MENKILKIGIVFGLVIMLTGISSVIAMKESKSYEAESVVLPLGTKKIGEIKYQLHHPGSTVAANLIWGPTAMGEGDYYADVEIKFSPTGGYWSVWASLDYSIKAVNRKTGETITFFDVSDRTFEFIDNPPGNINEDVTKTIPKGPWTVTVRAYGHFINKHCDRDDPDDDCDWVVTEDYELEDEESREYIFPKDARLTINLRFHNRPVFNLLARFPLLARLLQ